MADAEPAHPSALRGRRGIVIALPAAVAAAAGGWLLGERKPSPSQPVRLPALTSLDGRPTAASQGASARGQVIAFWATSCAICVQEMPALARLARRWALEGIGFAAVSMRYDHQELVRHYARLNPDSPPIVLDHDGTIADILGPVRATPSLVLLDAASRIRWRAEGAMDLAALESRLRALTVGA